MINHLVTTDWLEKNLDKVKILDGSWHMPNVNRNAFGRQIDSFEHDIDVEGLNDPYHSIFIRAPQVSRVGKNVEILASINKTKPVILKQDNILVSSFHPELTNDNRIHNLFMQMVLRR